MDSLSTPSELLPSSRSCVRNFGRPRTRRFRRVPAPLLVPALVLVPSSLCSPGMTLRHANPSTLLLLLVILCAPFAHAVKFALASSRYPAAKCFWHAAHNHQLVVVTANVAPNPAGSPQEQRVDLEIVDASDARHVYQVRVRVDFLQLHSLVMLDCATLPLLLLVARAGLIVVGCLLLRAERGRRDRSWLQRAPNLAPYLQHSHRPAHNQPNRAYRLKRKALCD